MCSTDFDTDGNPYYMYFIDCDTDRNLYYMYSTGLNMNSGLLV